MLLQLESLLYKGKTFHLSHPLLHIISLSELKSILMTTAYDVSTQNYRLDMGISSGQNQYTLLNGSETFLKTRDMYISDQMGVISNIIYNPGHHTRIPPGTSHALVTVYAPPRINRQMIKTHFSGIVLVADDTSLDPVVELKKILAD